MDNSLFKDISGLSNMIAEYTSEGWTRLFNCYSIGEERLNVILKQDILKREKRVATGRRAKNIGHHTIANMKKSNNNTRGRGRGRVQNKERERHNTKKYITSEMAKAKEKQYQYLINKSKEGMASMPCSVALRDYDQGGNHSLNVNNLSGRSSCRNYPL